MEDPGNLHGDGAIPRVHREIGRRVAGERWADSAVLKREFGMVLG
jgi:hypothetical protein